MTAQTELTRLNDTERNLILNRALTDLEQIINGHDPETDVPVKDGVWNRLDKMAQEIEARAPAVAVKPLEWRQGTTATDRIAHCECGSYSVCEIDGTWHAIRRFVDDGEQMEDEVIGLSDCRDISMQDCEDDRAARILSALSPQPPLSPQEAAKVLLADDVNIAKMAEAVHDGPLGADDHWFSAARPAGACCVDVVRAALRAIAGGEGHE